MKQKFIQILALFTSLGATHSFVVTARDFSYYYRGQNLIYTVINEEAKTCKTKDGYYGYPEHTAGNTVSGPLVIPENAIDEEGNSYSVISLGEYAFNGCTGLTSVTIPNSVTEIKGYAFHKCSGLIDVTIGNSVKEIGNLAFGECKALPYVNIPNSVTRIEGKAFYDCWALTDVTLPNSVKYIGPSTFFYCRKLDEVIIPDSITEICDFTFYGCRAMKSITIPKTVTRIGDSAFEGCYGLKGVHISDLEAWCKMDIFDCYANPLFNANNLYVNDELITDLVIPETITEIRDGTFYGCKGLKSLTIPKSVTKIGDGAFWNCSGLTSLNIPNSVTEIGTNAFGTCTSLTNVSIPNSITELKGYVFSGCSKLTSLTIPSSITAIGDFAFANCTALKSLTIPNSVTSIGGYAFQSCKGLTSMNIPGSIKEIRGHAFFDCSALAEVSIPNSITEISEGVFRNCSALKEINIPNTISKIGVGAFRECSSLKEIDIPNSVASIGGNAFRECNELTSVTIPNSVTQIDDLSFHDCPSLKEVHISDLEAWCNIDFNGVNSNPLYLVHNLHLNGKLVKDLIIPKNVKKIKRNAFYGFSGLNSVTLPDSVSEIGEAAFDGCTGLTSVTIPGSVSKIGEAAFNGCSEIKSLKIEDGETTLSLGSNSGYKGLFSDCPIETIYLGRNLSYSEVPFKDKDAIKSVTISNTVTEIADDAFTGCKGLKELKIEDGNSKLSLGNKGRSNKVFSDCPIETLYLGRNLTKSDAPFKNKDILKSVTIGTTVTEIIDETFEGCTALTELTIPNSVTEIGVNTFNGCSGLSSVTCLSETPPSIGAETFDPVTYSEATLIVPKRANRDYKNNDSWGLFYNIETLPILVDSIHVSMTECEKFIGESLNINATIFPEDADEIVEWTSSDTSVLSVDEDGFVTAVGVGSAIITATCGPVSTTCSMKVNPIKAADVTLNLKDLEIYVNEAEQLTATIAPENTTDKTVIWSSSDEEVVKVDENGYMTAVGPGSATITATCGSVIATCTVTAKIKIIDATGLTLCLKDIELYEDETSQLAATIAPENTTDKTVTWASSNEDVAIVDENGKVTAISAGTATIAATCGSVSAFCTVTVKGINATGLTLDIAVVEIYEAEFTQLTATITPVHAINKNITWNSNDTSVATVDANGKVTAISAGTATIAATCGTVSAFCTVTVKAKPSGIEDIEGEKAVRIEGRNIVAPEGSQVYNLSGRRVNPEGLTPGIYIVRIMGGKAIKVRVR